MVLFFYLLLLYFSFEYVYFLSPYNSFMKCDILLVLPNFFIVIVTIVRKVFEPNLVILKGYSCSVLCVPGSVWGTKRKTSANPIYSFSGRHTQWCCGVGVHVGWQIKPEPCTCKTIVYHLNGAPRLYYFFIFVGEETKIQRVTYLYVLWHLDLVFFFLRGHIPKVLGNSAWWSRDHMGYQE